MAGVAAAIELETQKCISIFVSILYNEIAPAEENEHENEHEHEHEHEMPLMRTSAAPVQTGINGDSRTLLDEYLLLQANEDGKFPFQEALSTGLATAVIGELVLRGLLVLHKSKNSKVLEPGSEYKFEFTANASIPTGVAILDDAITLMRSKPEESAVWWSRALTNYHMHKGIKHLATRSCEHAVQQGVLNKEDHSILHLFHHTKFHPGNGAGTNLRNELRDMIRAYALNGVRPQNIRRVALAALVYSLMRSRNVVKCVKTSVIFSKDERKLALHNLDNSFLYKPKSSAQV